jgi:hypothetical protein
MSSLHIQSSSIGNQPVRAAKPRPLYSVAVGVHLRDTLFLTKGQGAGLVNVLWAEAKATTYFSRCGTAPAPLFDPQVVNELPGVAAIERSEERASTRSTGSFGGSSITGLTPHHRGRSPAPPSAQSHLPRAVNLFALASGVDDLPDFKALFVPLDLGTFTCVALGLRASAGHRPPELPLTPPLLEKLRVTPTDPSKPIKRRLQECFSKEQFRSHAKRI